MTEAEARLAAAAQRYQEANDARSAAMSALRQRIIESDAAGIPRNRIVALANVARQTVYDTLHQSADVK